MLWYDIHVGDNGKRTAMNTCGLCGELTRNPKFCSNAHQAQAIMNAHIERALTQDVAPSNSYTCKRMIAVTRGFKCEMPDCGITEWKNQPVLLILDHIDGNVANHVWSNLRTVCSNCDAQLPTYKARNKKSSRAYRRERYANGQTY